MTLAAGNLATTAVLQERHEEALERSRETLLLCLRRGDTRGGAEAVLVLAAAAAGLGKDELSVKAEALSRALATNAGLVNESTRRRARRGTRGGSRSADARTLTRVSRRRRLSIDRGRGPAASA